MPASHFLDGSQAKDLQICHSQDWLYSKELSRWFKLSGRLLRSSPRSFFASHKGSEKTWGLKYPKTGGYSQKVVIETKNDAP